MRINLNVTVEAIKTKMNNQEILQKAIEKAVLDCIDAPDLSDLISWCGDEFKSLMKHDPLDDSMFTYRRAHGDFSAQMYDRDPSTFKNLMFGGHSPEEAVARLGMVINKK